MHDKKWQCDFNDYVYQAIFILEKDFSEIIGASLSEPTNFLNLILSFLSKSL